MPSWWWHKKYGMRTKGEDANNILKLLDGTVFPLHMRYRKLTHKPELAPKLALALALNAKDANYFDIWADIQNHIKDDETYNSLFYQQKKAKEAEQERT
jgi:hypothetical protein